jgi:hypothetical protein
MERVVQSLPTRPRKVVLKTVVWKSRSSMNDMGSKVTPLMEEEIKAVKLTE